MSSMAKMMLQLLTEEKSEPVVDLRGKDKALQSEAEKGPLQLQREVEIHMESMRKARGRKPKRGTEKQRDDAR